MKKPNKPYRVTLEMEAQEIDVMAQNQREAKRKAMAALKRRNPANMVRHNQSYVDER